MMTRPSFWCRGAVIAAMLAGCGGTTASQGPGTGEGAGPAGQYGQACPGAPEAEGAGRRCRSQAECAAREVCQPQPPISCTTGLSSCYRDAECESGQVCAETGPPSCFGSAILACGEPCSEGSCAPDERCRADGHCRLASCVEGYECPADRICGDEGTGDEHGCRAARCESDVWSCPDGYECQPGEQANRNGCIPISCTAGFECPVNSRCVTNSQYLHNHQCEVLTCERDPDCDCGFCIEGVCRNALSYCAMPPIG